MQFDDVGIVDLSGPRPSASFVNPDQRFQFIDRTTLDRQPVIDKTPNAGPLTGLADFVRVTCLEQQYIGLLTSSAKPVVVALVISAPPGAPAAATVVTNRRLPMALRFHSDSLRTLLIFKLQKTHSMV